MALLPRAIPGKAHLEFERTLPENNDLGVKAMTQIVFRAYLIRDITCTFSPKKNAICFYHFCLSNENFWQLES